MRTARFALAALALALPAAPAFAQQVRPLGDFREWSAFATEEEAGKICFALSKPQEVTPTPDGFTDAFLYLTHRPSENIVNEFNLIAGYTFSPDSTATVSIGSASFDLFTENDAAWLMDLNQSENLASAIRAGSSLTVEGTSDKGIKITQNFSLSGATAASQAIGGEC